MEKWQKQLVRYLFHYSAQHLQIEHAFMAKNPHIPDRLYKYRFFTENHKHALNENVLWRSPPAKFNDPYETAVHFNSERFFIEDRSLEDTIAHAKMLPKEPSSWRPTPLKNPIRARDLLKKNIQKILLEAPEDAKLLDEFSEVLEEFSKKQNENMMIEFTERMQNGFSVISLSELSTSILMWSHYSDAHQGFCIEYDFSALPYEDLRRRLCFPVYYRRKITDATRYLARTDLVNFNNLFWHYLCLLKGDEWAYEKEWRLVFPTDDSHANDEVLMPTPSSIILGIRVDSKNKQWMANFCKHNGMPLMQVRQQRDAFRLEVVPFPL